MVDTFVDALPLERKQRIHFHSFMRAVHAELKSLKNQPDPLRIVARRFAEKARVICLDEFFVADITDAMLLDGLLRELFANGVTLITTSNIEPDGLYKAVSYTHLYQQSPGRLEPFCCTQTGPKCRLLLDQTQRMCADYLVKIPHQASLFHFQRQAFRVGIGH